MTTYWRDNIEPAEEPARVLIKRGEWFDPTRNNRGVKYKIYYPDMVVNNPLPIIIWSHGLGGTQDGAGFISRFLSSHGYIHVNIGHEGTNDSLWRGKPGHPWDNIRKANIPWEDILNRYLDIPFVLNCLEQEELPIPIDISLLGMSGHSMGALTTQIIAGQLTGNETPISLKQNKFKAAIAYSPVPNQRLRPNDVPIQRVYGDIDLPMLHISGTEDYSPIDGPIQHLRDEIFNIGGKDFAMQYQVILDQADHMVFNGSRGQLPDYPEMELHKDQIKVMALAWWDYYLKNDPLSGHWLKNSLKDYLGKSNVVRVRNNEL